DSKATVGSCAAESLTWVLPAFSWPRTSAWTLLFTAWKALLASAFLEIAVPARYATPVPVPRMKCLSSSAPTGKPVRANPRATRRPRAWSDASVALSQALAACAVVSWLPFGATGWFPATVKEAPAAFGECPAECVAERAEAVADAGGSAPGDDREQPGSATATHSDAAEMT